jgi:hypothetical protein
VNQLLRPFLIVLAAIYFLADAVFVAVAHPIAAWLADRKIFAGLKAWVTSLGRYATLALFLVPFVVLEPAKPIAAYLAATGHSLVALGVLVFSEILKLVVVERLLAVSRDKLMSFAAFAWANRQYRQVISWLEETGAWQAMRRLSETIRHTVRSYLIPRRPARISFDRMGR